MVIPMLLSLLFYLPMLAAQEQISIQLSSPRVHQNQPIQGSLTITHPKDNPAKNLRMASEEFSLEKEQEEEVGPDRVRSHYSWRIPPKEQGLYLLPPVEAEVGDQILRSRRITVQVIPQRIALFPGGILFYLEAEWEGPQPLYPGEKGFMVYRIFFNRPITMTEEALPLLQPEGMVRLGEIQVRETEKGGIAVQEIRQAFQAQDPGVYTYGPSRLEGRPTRGTPREKAQTIFAEAPPVSLEILPFPKEGQPNSFTGTIGDVLWTVTKETPGPSDVGDPIWLQLSFTGEGDIAQIRLPNFSCQPGFSGLFLVGEPKIESITDRTKVFLLPIRPLASFLGNLPPVEFSYFDRQKGEYARLQKGPFPIEVRQKAAPERQEKDIEPLIWEIPPEKERPSSLFPISLQKSELPALSLPWLYLLIPLGTFLLLLQKHWRNRVHENFERIRSMSRTLFYEAERHVDDPVLFYSTLEQALRLRLVEMNCAKSTLSPPSQWQKTPFSVKVQNWLAETEKKRYGAEKKNCSPASLEKEWKQWKKEWP